jgi:hypothetical protein
MSANALFSAASREVLDTEDALAFKAALPAVAPLEPFCGADLLKSSWESHLVEAANLTLSLRAVFEGRCFTSLCKSFEQEGRERESGGGR